MKKLKFFSIIFFLINFMFLDCYSQENIVSSGINISGSDGTLSYSIGQIVTSTYYNDSCSISNGVQQPFEITEITSIKLMDAELDVNVFPNPMRDFLTVQLDTEYEGNLEYQLFNINGQLIQKSTIGESRIELNMSNYPSVTYLLIITKKNVPIKVFEILKN